MTVPTFVYDEDFVSAQQAALRSVEIREIEDVQAVETRIKRAKLKNDSTVTYIGKDVKGVVSFGEAGWLVVVGEFHSMVTWYSSGMYHNVANQNIFEAF